MEGHGHVHVHVLVHIRVHIHIHIRHAVCLRCSGGVVMIHVLRRLARCCFREKESAARVESEEREKTFI